MNRRIPVIPTILVVAAVATMIALGFWQLGRAHERDAIQQRMVAHAALPLAEYPYSHPVDPAMLYRRLSGQCAAVLSWQVRGGSSADGQSGWRHIATCRAPGGSTFQADMGVSAMPDRQPAWAGGTVTGHSVLAPDVRGLADRAFARQAPRKLMIVAEQPAPGLAPSSQPDPSAETNSSWSYTGQWFLFALTALVIYALALRKRWREPR